MNSVRKFCDERKITQAIESAFSAYCKSYYADKFGLMEGDTVSKIVSSLTDEEVLEMWNRFILDLKSILTEKNVS